MRSRWVLIGLLIAAAALAASWGLGLWASAPPEPVEDAGPAIATSPPARPTRSFAWTLPSSRSSPPPPRDNPVQEAQPAPSDVDVEPCGEGGPCPVGSACVDGGCLSTACLHDGGLSRCTLPNGKQGMCCGERCTDLQGDPAGCGRCGARCRDGQECMAGRCQAQSCKGQMAGAVCSSRGGAGVCCRGGCMDPSAWASDPASCGGCGHACAPGLACRQGICVDPATGGRPAWTCLDEGHGCPDGAFCVIDACFPRACTGDNDGLLCPISGGQLGHCCAQKCANLFEDSVNCGGCGVRCPEHQECRDGECGAPSQPRGAR